MRVNAYQKENLFTNQVLDEMREIKPSVNAVLLSFQDGSHNNFQHNGQLQLQYNSR